MSHKDELRTLAKILRELDKLSPEAAKRILRYAENVQSDAELARLRASPIFTGQIGLANGAVHHQLPLGMVDLKEAE